MLFRLIFAIVVTLNCSVQARAEEWKPVTVELLKSEKTGYGGLCGVVVHPPSGDLIVNLSDRGLFRSKDQGTTWQRLGTTELKGRTETPLCLMLDPFEQQRLVSAFVYGSPIIVSENQGSTWKTMAASSEHVDWCAVDWKDPELKFVLTLKHESGDLLLVSRNGGTSFDEVGKGYGPAWIFDHQTAVVAEAKSTANPRPGLLRTTDAGRSFVKCTDDSIRALPRFKSGALYWLTTTGLIRSADQGSTWNRLSDVKNGVSGPVFGKDSQHLFVLTSAGILESRDGGVTWLPAIALPKDLKGTNYLSWVEYDAVHDSLYVMKMDSELFQWRRGATDLTK